MPFQNLYFKHNSFRDSNWNDDLDRLDQIDECYIEARIRGKLLEGEPIDPYFDRVIPLTLGQECCASFIQANPLLPINERDYYLSKLFQFLYLPISVWLDLDYCYRFPEANWDQGRVKTCHERRDKIRERLEGFLDGIPDALLPELHRFDWWGFFEQVDGRNPEPGHEDEDLENVLHNLPKCLPVISHPARPRKQKTATTKAAKERGEWLDRELASRNASTPERWSDATLSKRGGPAYNTIRAYRRGETTAQTHTVVRPAIAKALGVPVTEVPR